MVRADFVMWDYTLFEMPLNMAPVPGQEFLLRLHSERRLRRLCSVNPEPTFVRACSPFLAKISEVDGY